MPYLGSKDTKNGKTFRVIYYWNGKRETFTIGVTTKRIALQRKAQVEALLAMGKNPLAELRKEAVSESRVSDLLAKDRIWSEGRRQPGTMRINLWAMEQFINWGKDPKLTSVDKPMIEKFIIYLRQDLQRNETTVNMIVRQLKASFQRAVDEHSLLTEHPFRTTKLLSQSKQNRKPNYLTLEQVSILIAGISDLHFKRLVCFYLWTGCRRTEALELKWNDIDWQNGELYLGQANSKTKIRRSFPFRGKVEIQNLLEELKGDKSESDLVFWRFSKVISNISNMLKRIRERTDGLPETLTTHSLRHTFASHMVMAGVDITTVAKLLGHTTSKTTEIYAHLLPQHIQSSISKLPY